MFASPQFPTKGPLDRWICPPYAREGPLQTTQRLSLPLPAGTLLYCRAGDRGPGLAARVPKGGIVTVVGGNTPSFVATGFGGSLEVEWVVFGDAGELGK